MDNRKSEYFHGDQLSIFIYSKVLKNITDECSNPKSSYFMSPGQLDKNCTSYYKGQFAACLFHSAGYLCPTPIEDDECKEVRKHAYCMWEKYSKTESPA